MKLLLSSKFSTWQIVNDNQQTNHFQYKIVENPQIRHSKIRNWNANSVNFRVNIFFKSDAPAIWMWSFSKLLWFIPMIMSSDSFIDPSRVKLKSEKTYSFRCSKFGKKFDQLYCVQMYLLLKVKLNLAYQFCWQWKFFIDFV